MTGTDPGDRGAPSVFPAEPTSILRAAEAITAGLIVGIPTETLYGLAVDARDPAAVDALYRAKQRPQGRPFPLLVADPTMLQQLVSRIPKLAERLMARHWPGPLTLVLPAAPNLSPALVGPGGGVGVRLSSDPVVGDVLAAVGRPITATSANRSGQPPAHRAADVDLPGLALVLDGGPRRSEPSTVVSLLDDKPRILRRGAVTPDLR